MKILITENKRYQLAYKILDDILDGLTREDTDLNRDKDSVFSNHQVTFLNEDDENILEISYAELSTCSKLPRIDILNVMFVSSFHTVPVLS